MSGIGRCSFGRAGSLREVATCRPQDAVDTGARYRGIKKMTSSPDHEPEGPPRDRGRFRPSESHDLELSTDAVESDAREVGSLEAARAVQLADFASHTLSLGVRLAEQVDLTAELREAVRSQTLIDQALGIIMSQRRCDAETAMAILSAASLDRDESLAVRAVQIRTAAGAPPPANGHRPAPTP